MAPTILLVLVLTLHAVLGRLGEGGPRIASRWWNSSCPQASIKQTFGNVKTSQIDECSGLASSRVNKGLYWVNNDSGETTRLFAIDKSGAHLARLWVNGAEAIDWEDIAIGAGPEMGKSYIYIADTGDNHKSRSNVQIYRGLEPKVPAGRDRNWDIDIQVERFDISYPGGPRDCEAMFVDHISQKLYVITKGPTAAEVYSVRLGASSPLMFELHGSIGVDWVTGAAISPDGSLIAVRSYGEVLMWPRRNGTTVEESLLGTDPCGANKADEKQGEAIAFGSEGDHYLTVSEGKKPAVWYFNLTQNFYESVLALPSGIVAGNTSDATGR